MIVQNVAAAGEWKRLRRARDVAAKNGGHAGDRIQDQKIGERSRTGSRLVRKQRRPEQVAVAGDDPCVGMAKARARIGKECGLPRKLLWMPEIVLVAEGEEIGIVPAGSDAFSQTARKVPMHTDAFIEVDEMNPTVAEALDQ